MQLGSAPELLGSSVMTSHQSPDPAPLDERLGQMALQLQAAHDALEKTRRTQSDFLWAMGHAFRSPLTAILGFAQLMDGGAATPTPSQKKSLAQILKAGWDLLALIDEIVDVSLIQSGRLPLHKEPVSLRDVLRDCETRVQPLAHRSGARVVFDWPAQPLIVSADRTRLQQILMTLLGHSLLHSGAAGEVHVSCQVCTDGRLRVNFMDSSAGQSAAWLASAGPVTQIQLIVSQQIAGTMDAIIATEVIAPELIASKAGEVRAYWLELNAAGSTP